MGRRSGIDEGGAGDQLNGELHRGFEPRLELRVDLRRILEAHFQVPAIRGRLLALEESAGTVA